MLLITFIFETVNDLAQTGEPIIVKTIFTPTLLKKVLLPAMLEPVTRFNPSFPCVEKELVTRSSFGIKGCPKVSAITVPCFSAITGKAQPG